MKGIILALSALLILGCAAETKSRYDKHYTKTAGSYSFIQGDGYKLWYDRKTRSQLNEVKKGTSEWTALQKFMRGADLDQAFYNPKTDIFAVVGKLRNKIPYDKVLLNVKKQSTDIIIESDKRIVNNTPVLYLRSVFKEDGTRLMMSTYIINVNSGSLYYLIGCRKDDYRKYRITILKTLNAIEIDQIRSK